MLQQPHSVASSGFENGLSHYTLSRPKYTEEALSLIKSLIPQNSRVLDLGAGTGIMTKSLVDAHYQVTAVEPVSGMRKQIVADLPGVTVIDGTAWDTTLPSESQDAIVVAQAFHWFADLKTLHEMHRILKPNGKLVLIWNMECKAKARWVHALRNLVEAYDGNVPQYRTLAWQNVWETDEAGTLFDTPLDYQHLDYDMPCTRENVVRRLLSNSYIAVLPKDEQDKLESKINAVLDDPELGFTVDPHTGQCIFPHDTHINWTQKK